MLGLKLREEFSGALLKGTAIELTNAANTGATQVDAASFLEISYPTADVVRALKGIAPEQARPLVLLGERGQGKSHLLAVLHHALSSHEAARRWLGTWAARLHTPELGSTPLRGGMLVISESLHRQRHKHIWDVLLDRHPQGAYIRGKWEALGERRTDVPSDTLILELLRSQPVALLLDEFQTWYEGLRNTDDAPDRSRAFGFVQLLSEIAREHPELLLVVVSVRSGRSDAYQQIHRVAPIVVDFKGEQARRDRLHLILHRLFANRLNVARADIGGLVRAHLTERLRLLPVAESEHGRIEREALEAWPFSPELVAVLEDRVLESTEAQETRDLIRILAALYRTHGDRVPVLTPADFRVDDEDGGVPALLDSLSSVEHATLRERALRNYRAVQDASAAQGFAAPHLAEVIGALWVRSLTADGSGGALPNELQVDATRQAPIDDNAFRVELAAIAENSFNVHTVGDRLVFRLPENPQTKLLSYARNDRLFQDGKDEAHLAKEVRYLFEGAGDVARAYRVFALPRSWTSEPWGPDRAEEGVLVADQRIPLVVLPECPEGVHAALGTWLRDHVHRRRNTIRFILPRVGTRNLYVDENIIVMARAVMKAQEWKADDPQYGRLATKYHQDLQRALRDRFDRFAILRAWNFGEPARCVFHVEALRVQGVQTAEAIETKVREDLFVPEELEIVVMQAATVNDSLGKLLKELQEPRAGGGDCIPWLGEQMMKERVVRLCAAGKIQLNLQGRRLLRREPEEDEEIAWRRMRTQVGSGRELDDTDLLLPQPVAMAQGVFERPTTGPAATNVTPSPPPPPDPAGAPAPVSVFASPTAASFVSLEATPTSALNLLARLEAWGIGPGTQVRELSLSLATLSGAQLQKLLKDLPDGLLYELRLKRVDE